MESCVPHEPRHEMPARLRGFLPSGSRLLLARGFPPCQSPVASEDDVSNQFGIARIGGRLVEQTRRHPSPRPHPFRNPAIESGLFVQSPDRGPQCGFCAERKFDAQAIRPVRMSDAAPKAHQLPLFQLPQNTVALGTSEHRWCTFAFVGAGHILVLVRSSRAFRSSLPSAPLSVFHHQCTSRCRGKFDEHGSNLACRQDVIRCRVLNRVRGHVSPHGFVRILHDGDAAPFLNGVETRGAVILQSAQNDPHHA